MNQPLSNRSRQHYSNSDDGLRFGGWRPSSWRTRPVRQQATYRDEAGLAAVLDDLGNRAPVVDSADVDALKGRLAEAAEGRAFLIQGGSCAERFADSAPEVVSATAAVLRHVALVLGVGLGRPVVMVGRWAGQYAKPRSSDVERRRGIELPSYRGDMVNGCEFDAEARRARPDRLLEAWRCARRTLAAVPGGGGCVDFSQPSVVPIWRSRRFRRSVAAAEIFASHEGLHLGYEEALTRRCPRSGNHYDLSTHVPWIGKRTAHPDQAHVEFFSGIRNPIAVKVGPEMSPECLRELLERLDPNGEPGRLTLIQRFGCAQVRRCLPPLIDEVRKSGKPVLWACDPMHGNTESTASGRKTRRLETICDEIEQSSAIHRALGSRLGGLHLELTGDEVTECIGGSSGLGEEDLERAYRTAVDPRLNPSQAIEVATRFALYAGSR